MSEITLQTGDGGTVAVTDEALGALRDRLQGDLLLPSSDGYETMRRVWNRMIDRRPGLIVRCATAGDVAECVGFANRHGLLVAVRGGGHGVSGAATCDGGMMIDLSRMREVTVDAARRIAHVQGGATLGDIDGATQAFALAAPVGVVSETGIGGLALGGGFGWLLRKHGLTCDNVLAVDIVTADGKPRHASADEHPDLYWAIRGGGGNFGVVTSFDLRLHSVGPQVAMAAPFYAYDRAADALRYFRDYMATAPEDVMAMAVLWSFPEAPEYPREWHGRPTVAFVAVHGGPVEEGERVLAPLRQFETPVADLSGTLPWVQVQRFFDESYPSDGCYYWKSVYLDGLSDEAIDVIVEQALERPSAESEIDIWQLGGAFARRRPDETAVWHRSAGIMVGVEANWRGSAGAPANIGWARDTVSRLKPLSSGGLYANFAGLGEEGEPLVRDIYGGNYARLAAVKAKYDPSNLFRLNHNIRPKA